MATKTKIGIIGCGNISGIYFKNLKAFENTEVAACADMNPLAAKAKGKEYGVPAVSVEELLNDKAIQIVLNLTIPKAHAEVAIKALNAGKHVYNEKPLAVSLEDGQKMVALAKSKNLQIGCAPDTFLGAGIQTARKAIDDGLIGKPVAATAFMTCHGHESWHPAPEFYYQVGGGPMFDMGPYYLTALINLLGPVARVTGSANISFPERLITSQPKAGTKIKVEVPTHVAGILDFKNGAMATILTSFDVWHAHLPSIEIYGSEGSLQVPDPNGFGGVVRLRTSKDSEWRDLPLSHDHADNSRGIGVSDLAMSLSKEGVPRASGELAMHVLEIMHAIHTASSENKHVQLKSSCKRPEAFAPLKPGIRKSSYGKLADGREAFLYTLRNNSGAELKITDYGCTVTSIQAPDKAGKLEDVVLGFDTLENYLESKSFFGCSVGRYANRIKGAQFKLNGKTYKLAKNNANNSLHGGWNGFNKALWSVEERNTPEGPALLMSMTSPDGEEGYPGTLRVKALHTWTHDNTLRIDYSATTDKATVINLTNHSYFNLAGHGKGQILDHEVEIMADKFTPLGAGLIPTGKLKPVKGTPFDFNKPTAIGARIDQKDKQLKGGKGYDMNYVLRPNKGGKLVLAARVRDPKSGRILEASTTAPGVQFYTAGSMKPQIKGKRGAEYGPRAGFCLEPQHFPNSPNQKNFPSTVLKPGETYKHSLSYRFKTE